MLNNLQSKNDKKVTVIFAAITTFFVTCPVSVQAQNLTKAKEVLEKFKEQLDLIIPVASAVMLLCLAIGYAGRYIEKDTFVRWAIGVIIAGSAVQIANMLFKPN